MAGHAKLKFVMTECSKTQIRLTGLNYTVLRPIYFHVVININTTRKVMTARSNSTKPDVIGEFNYAFSKSERDIRSWGCILLYLILIILHVQAL